MDTVEFINQKLIDEYGLDTSTNQPIFRVVWSDDQYEHRKGTYEDFTEGGIYIRTVTEVRLVPKYSQWKPHVYCLERLVLVPDRNIPELPAVKLSYEPLFFFEDVNNNPLPPRWIVAKIAVDAVYAAQGKRSLRHWKEEFSCQEEELEDRKQRIAKMQDYIFGDESAINDAIRRKEGIFVPGPTNSDKT